MSFQAPYWIWWREERTLQASHYVRFCVSFPANGHWSHDSLSGWSHIYTDIHNQYRTLKDSRPISVGYANDTWPKNKHDVHGKQSPLPGSHSGRDVLMPMLSSHAKTKSHTTSRRKSVRENKARYTQCCTRQEPTKVKSNPMRWQERCSMPVEDESMHHSGTWTRCHRIVPSRYTP